MSFFGGREIEMEWERDESSVVKRDWGICYGVFGERKTKRQGVREEAE